MKDNSGVSLLANRYASAAMREIFAPEAKIIAERKLWIAVMRAQSTLGHAISKDVITDYEKVITQVDLASIDAREKKTRHDVKARIEEFNALAGHEAIHAGMTSRDLTENIEALQIRNGLDVVHDKVVTVLARLAERATQYADQPVAGRSHNVPAQITTLGKRFASAAEELLFAYERLTALQDRYPMRGIKGPVGTAQDSIDLLGSTDAHAKLENTIAKELGFNRVLDSTGQIYPRSFDYDVVTTLVQLASSPSSLATSIRLMAGAELVTEGFKAGQVGSSAMPHKMNTRSCERVNGLSVVLRGYASMVSELAGDQWNEGDVSCSVVRRVALPDAFYAIDGLLETTLTVLSEFGAFPAVIAAELDRYGVKINGIAPSARSRMTEEAFADMMKKPDSGFDAMDPANVSPVVVWLGSSACEISGRMFETAGGELSVADGWQHGQPFNKGARYEPAEIGAVIADLIREAPKPAAVYGAN